MSVNNDSVSIPTEEQIEEHLKRVSKLQSYLYSNAFVEFVTEKLGSFSISEDPIEQLKIVEEFLREAMNKERLEEKEPPLSGPEIISNSLPASFFSATDKVSKLAFLEPQVWSETGHWDTENYKGKEVPVFLKCWADDGVLSESLSYTDFMIFLAVSSMYAQGEEVFTTRQISEKVGVSEPIVEESLRRLNSISFRCQDEAIKQLPKGAFLPNEGHLINLIGGNWKTRQNKVVSAWRLSELPPLFERAQVLKRIANLDTKQYLQIPLSRTEKNARVKHWLSVRIDTAKSLCESRYKTQRAKGENFKTIDLDKMLNEIGIELTNDLQRARFRELLKRYFDKMKKTKVIESYKFLKAKSKYPNKITHVSFELYVEDASLIKS